ncbi:hypothetical protein [Limosilactobacillus reuteri]|nr:hypothetical protein [Limosilactobacillus reuteri]
MSEKDTAVEVEKLANNVIDQAFLLVTYVINLSTLKLTAII